MRLRVVVRVCVCVQVFFFVASFFVSFFYFLCVQFFCRPRVRECAIVNVPSSLCFVARRLTVLSVSSLRVSWFRCRCANVSSSVAPRVVFASVLVPVSMRVLLRRSLLFCSEVSSLFGASRK